MSNNKGRKPRVMIETCFRQVLNRLIKELKLDLHVVAEETNIPFNTIYYWTVKDITPNNPDQVKRLAKYLKKFKRFINLDYLYYGTDEDQEALRKRIAELEEEKRKLEIENANQMCLINYIEEQGLIKKSSPRKNE